MTISPLEIYLISLVDKIGAISEVIIFLSGLTSILFFVFWMIGKSESYKTEEDEKTLQRLWKFLKVSSICVLCSTLIHTFIPSSKTIAAMYLIPAIVNNEHIQNSTSNALKMLEGLTKEWLEDFIKKEPKKDGIHT